MAASSHNVPPAMDGSSQEKSRLECNSCKYEGITAPAKVFCEDCKDYLCDICLKLHRKNKTSKKHKITTAIDIPKCRQPGEATCSDTTSTPLMDSVFWRKPRKFGDYKINHKTDKHNVSYILCCHFLSDGQLLLCDGMNDSLKLLSQTFKVKAGIKMPANPNSVSSFSDKEAIVLMPPQKTLQFVKVKKSSLKLDRQMNVFNQNRDCHLFVVHCYRNKLHVIYREHGKIGIMVLNTDGEILSRIGETDLQEQFKVLNNPTLTMDTEGRMYTSHNPDHDTGAVLRCFTETGEPIHTYTHDNLIDAGALVAINQNSVLVAGSVLYEVQVIDLIENQMETILKAKDGIISRPQSLAYRPSDQVLVVGLFDSDKIAVFKFQE